MHSLRFGIGIIGRDEGGKLKSYGKLTRGGWMRKGEGDMLMRQPHTGTHSS